MDSATSHHIADQLDASDYTRQRMDPRPGDQFYLHLLDLRQSLGDSGTRESVHLLDFGCGGSPYRGLFPNATYHRADYVPMPGLQFQVTTEGTIPEAAASAYDVILSTQVLEHVPNPQTYLAEALRVLKPGGKLVLSTHGTFPDHGCPYDFWRWTADGLATELTRAGFCAPSIQRLTCGPRAVLFLFDQLCFSRSSGFLPRMLSAVYRRMRSLTNRIAACCVASHAQNSAPSTSSQDICIALLATATKPNH